MSDKTSIVKIESRIQTYNKLSKLGKAEVKSGRRVKESKSLI